MGFPAGFHSMAPVTQSLKVITVQGFTPSSILGIIGIHRVDPVDVVHHGPHYRLAILQALFTQWMGFNVCSPGIPP